MSETRTASVVVLEMGDHVLCIERLDEASLGKFALPGGKREAHETYEEAAIREIKEETGVDIFDLEKVYECVDCENYNVVTFKANFRGAPRPAEGKRVVWMSWDDITSGPKAAYPEYNSEVRKAMSVKIIDIAEDVPECVAVAAG